LIKVSKKAAQLIFAQQLNWMMQLFTRSELTLKTRPRKKQPWSLNQEDSPGETKGSQSSLASCFFQNSSLSSLFLNAFCLSLNPSNSSKSFQCRALASSDMTSQSAHQIALSGTFDSGTWTLFGNARAELLKRNQIRSGELLTLSSCL
jgi:hypothetical protein